MTTTQPRSTDESSQQNQGPLAGRVAIVTGASAGIGQAIAKHFVLAGASVVINARREERLSQVLAELQGLPGAQGRVAMVAGDASSNEVLTALLETCVSKFGKPCDLAVVNAGRGLNGSVLTSDTSEWEEMIRTNVLGAARFIRLASERMLASGPGGPASTPKDIIVLGSVVGRHVSPFSSMYGGTKFAVHGMVEGVRRELAGKWIRVSLIEPGFVVSEFQQVAGYKPEWVGETFAKIGPPLVPDDVARAVNFVASQPAGVHISDLLIRPTRQEYP